MDNKNNQPQQQENTEKEYSTILENINEYYSTSSK